MKISRLFFSLFLFIALFGSELFSASLPLTIEGEYLIRLPSSTKYIRSTLKSFPDNIICSIPNDRSASDTLLILDGHRVKLYPGASFKISKGAFIPLLGRFEFSTSDDDENTINIIANNCNAAYNFGHFLIEATPDNGVFFAMKSKGSAWVKDLYRKVYELKQGQQVQIPIFGQSISKNHLEAFWGKAPSSFGHLGEAGQETAYGIVGKDSNFSSSSIKSSKESENTDEEDSETEEQPETEEDSTITDNDRDD